MAGWFFQICPTCGKHGRPISPDGDYGWEMASKESAKAWVDEMYKHVPVSIEEMAEMLSGINVSTLAEREGEANPAILNIIRLWNDLNGETDFVGNPDQIHETVARLLD